MTTPQDEKDYTELIIALVLMYYLALSDGVDGGAAQVGAQGIDIDEGLLLYSVNYVNELLSSINQTTIDRANKIIQEWDGLDRGELNKKLETIFSEARAQSIGVTENTKAFQIGNLVAWATLGLALRGVIWHTQQDARVCPICAPRNNQVFEVGLDNPPAHPGCRCWTSPAIL